MNEQGLNSFNALQQSQPQLGTNQSMLMHNNSLQAFQVQHKPSTSGGPSAGLSGNGSFTNVVSGVLNLSTSHKANTSNTSGATVNTQSNGPASQSALPNPL